MIFRGWVAGFSAGFAEVVAEFEAGFAVEPDFPAKAPLLEPLLVMESTGGVFWTTFFKASTLVVGWPAAVSGAPPAEFGAAAGAVPPVDRGKVAAGAVPGTAGGLTGTEGSRCARMSAALILLPVSAMSGALSCFSVTTRTSSTRLRSAAGLTWMFRNMSWPVLTLLTVPTGSPLGKIWSPPLLNMVSPGVTDSSLITRSRINSPSGVPRTTPCKRDFSIIAPTPLL